MRKLLFIAPLLLGLVLTSCFDENFEKINSRLDALENTTIATINQQISSINNSITLLDKTDKELGEYIDALEAEAENLNSQLTATNTKIDEVKKKILTTLSSEKASVLAELEAFRSSVNSQLEVVNATLETLKAKDAELAQQIADLNKYVTTELKNTKDWTEATFATLEQYEAVTTTIATIEGKIKGLNESLVSLENRINDKIAKDIATASAALSADIKTSVEEVTAAYTSAIATAKTEITEAYTSAFKAAIATSESSMKEWVNEQLTGYYTIAEMDAKLSVLQTTITDGDGNLQQQINNLSSDLTKARSEITEAYQTAIADAIATNNGVVDDKISAAISSVNEKIKSLENRINTLEERITSVEDAIEQIKALDIVFDITETPACMAGASVNISYTVQGGDNATAVEAWGDGGWSARVVAENAEKGYIKVTAPQDATDGKVVVLATSGAGGVSMKTIYFEEGVLADIQDTYNVDWEACTFDVTLRTNLNYTVQIPTEAQEWLSVVDGTRATIRTDKITFSVHENPEDMPVRSAVVRFIGECGDELQSFEVVQDFQPSGNPIVFADENVKKVCVEHFDTNGDGELSELEASKVTTLPSNFFGGYNKAISTFTELQYFTRLTSIGPFAFEGCSLKQITLPQSITSIESYSFSVCSRLESISIPESVTKIADSAFTGCSRLASFTIPESVTYIGPQAFWGCSNLKDVYITDIDKVELFKEETCILNAGANLWNNGELVTEYTFPNGILSIDNRLAHCTSIKTVNIPEGALSIEREAFSCCSSLENITIPESVVYIEEDAFYGCRGLTSITIPNSLTDIGSAVFFECTGLTSVTIPNSVTSIGYATFYGCTGLTSIDIPNSVTEIGQSAFDRCTSLTEIILPESVKVIRESAFYNCI